MLTNVRTVDLFSLPFTVQKHSLTARGNLDKVPHIEYKKTVIIHIEAYNGKLFGNLGKINFKKS